MSISKSAMTAIMVAVVLTGGGYWFSQYGLHIEGTATSSSSAVAGQFVYTARTANDAAITLPAVVQAELLQAGLADKPIELTRVGFTGDVSTSYIDMTPRAGNSSQGPVLKVAGRAVPVIEAKISGIEAAVNSPAGATGGRALLTGLTRIDFTDAPVTIISSGLDLGSPDDFRSLNWTVPPAQVVADAKKAGALPALHGPVTFVIVPPAGSQAPLDQAQKNYRDAVWTALLKAAGATSVTFIDASGITPSSPPPSMPTVSSLACLRLIPPASAGLILRRDRKGTPRSIGEPAPAGIRLGSKRC